jgi:hypothetical protein
MSAFPQQAMCETKMFQGPETTRGHWLLLREGRACLSWLITEIRQGKVKGMELTVSIPDDIAERLGEGSDRDLSRRALEAFLAEEYRLGHLNKPDLRRLLGFETSYEIDGFLKAHNVYEDYTLEDFEREREALKSLGL